MMASRSRSFCHLSSLIICIICWQLIPTNRTSIPNPQPWHNAFTMITVHTRQLFHSLPHIYIILANCTNCIITLNIPFHQKP
ncbi:hypothetical protein OIU79_030152 [Salix purpurea]|uniref:Secreted protein n=1 Tax=Salix purpurea TaxID=77065 RepID=A0A9Q0ZWJ7_SALPP|nr:hypothetical protein OIU79_030152 [Salix purpurea]